MMMRPITCTLLLGSLLPVTNTVADSSTVYETLSPDGVPQFSGQPGPGAVPEHIQTPNLMTPVQAESTVPGNSGTNTSSPSGPVAIRISRPVSQQSIWSGSGDVKVSFSTSSSQAGIQYQILLDSQLVDTTDHSPLLLHNIYRGQHSLQVEAVDADGQILGTSPVIIFFMHRPIDHNPATRLSPARP